MRRPNPTADNVPNGVYNADKTWLSQNRETLMAELSALNTLIAAHDAKCSHVADNDQALIAVCTSESQDLQTKITDYQNDLADYNDLLKTRVSFHNEFNKYINSLHLSKAKLDHLNNVLNSLAEDGNPDATVSQTDQVWKNILARRDFTEEFEREAKSSAPVMPGAGTQSFNDCTIFALANAADLPYSVVAAKAAGLISESQWHSDADRANPQDVLEKHGLDGYEVALLAESLGQAEVVPMSDFPKTLQEGRPLILDVMLQDGGKHEVVLTKTFQHFGETWYEMMDSNQGRQQRLYLSTNELSTMLLEKGIAFRPNPGTTPQLLR